MVRFRGTRIACFPERRDFDHGHGPSLNFWKTCGLCESRLAAEKIAMTPQLSPIVAHSEPRTGPLRLADCEKKAIAEFRPCNAREEEPFHVLIDVRGSKFFLTRSEPKRAWPFRRPLTFIFPRNSNQNLISRSIALPVAPRNISDSFQLIPTPRNF